MLMFMLRVFSLDLLNAFPGGVVRVTQTSHKINMQAQNLDASLEIVKTVDEKQLKINLKFLKNDIVGVDLRAYWGVDIPVFHHVLRSPWDWFQDAFEKGNLFGSQACLRLDPMMKIYEESTLDLDVEPGLDLGTSGPRTKYPLVMVVKSDIFQIYAIHVEDKSFISFPSHILGHYVKCKDSSVTHLVPIYTSTNEDSECVVCISRPATRVNLPCRHASTCAICFKQLPQGKCPMCRCQIQSYFLIGNEDEVEDSASEDDQQPLQSLSWRQRLSEIENRFAMAVGLQEHD